jgi:hypothetical protein
MHSRQLPFGRLRVKDCIAVVAIFVALLATVACSNSAPDSSTSSGTPIAESTPTTGPGVMGLDTPIAASTPAVESSPTPTPHGQERGVPPPPPPLPHNCDISGILAPHVFQASDGTFTDRVSLDWSAPLAIERVDPSLSSPGTDPVLAVGDNGDLHILYKSTTYSDGNYTYLYASKSSGDECWQVESVELTGTPTNIRSMVVDQNGYLHIAYRGLDTDSLSGVIYHASKGPNYSWQAEVVASETGVYPDITVDPSGVVHIAYLLGFDIRYAVSSSTSWSIDTLVIPTFLAINSTAQATEVAIEVSNQGKVHIAYPFVNSVSQGTGMGYAYKTATGSWSYEVVDQGDFSGVDISVNPLCGKGFFGEDCPAVSYIDSVAGHLKFGERSQYGQWIVETVGGLTPGPSPRGKTRLSIDVKEWQKGYLNSVHIAAYNELPSGVPAIMRHSRPLTFGEWSFPQTIEVDTGSNAYLAASGTGLHMVYSRAGREWPGGVNLETYQAASGPDMHLSHAFVSPDVSFNVYRQLGTEARSIIGTVEDNSYDNTDVIQDVVYGYSIEATQNSIIGNLSYVDEGHAASWMVETIDNSENDVGESVSIAYAGADLLHIAYLDTTDDDLLYVPYSSSSLVDGMPEIVDGGRVEDTTDIIVGYAGKKHISYFVGHPDNELAYAWAGGSGNWQLSRPDEDGPVGKHSSIMFGGSATFAEAEFSSLPTPIGLGNYGPPGTGKSSVAIGSDGMGLISYYARSYIYDDLMVAHCSDVACTSATITTLDAAGSVGTNSSVAIGSDGMGLISYYASDYIYDDLKVAHCSDVACTSATITTLDGAGGANVGMYSSVATGSDGMGLISYYDETLSALKVAHCSDVACTSATITTLDGAGGANVGMFSSVAVGMFSSNVAIGSDGMGLISYYDSDDKDLKIAHCSDVACTSATITTLDGAGGANVGMFSSVATGSDGIVLISYLDSDSMTVKIIGVSAPRQIGIAYYDVANNSLKFANGSSTWNAAVTDWAAQTVSATGSNNGQYTNVVYDESASRVHVSYFSTSSVGTLNHVTGTWDNISQEYQWSSPAVIVDGSPTLKYSTLTLDSDGRPHVVFRQGGKIKHAWGLWSAATNSWSWPTMFVEEIQSGVGNNGGVDMVTGAANSLHISFYDGYNSSDITPVTLKYASASYNSASDSWAWQVESVDGSSSLDVGEYSAITIDESGAVFIAYYDATNGNLKIAHN